MITGAALFGTIATVHSLMRDDAWRQEFARGMRDMLPSFPGICAWGLVTGVAMVKSGLSVPLALLMSLAAYAGSAQLAALRDEQHAIRDLPPRHAVAADHLQPTPSRDARLLDR